MLNAEAASVLISSKADFLMPQIRCLVVRELSGKFGNLLVIGSNPLEKLFGRLGGLFHSNLKDFHP
jgi:hypothetical protein